MKRGIEDRNILERFALDFVSVLEKHAKYAVVSGFVAIAHGRSRGTEDVDVIAERLPREAFLELHKGLEKAGFECIRSSNARELYDRYLSQNLSIRYVKRGKHLPEIEFKLSKDALDEYQLNTRKRLPLTGLGLYFSSIEMNIAFKEELLKSDKDLEDARHLRIVYEGKVNEAEIEKIKHMIREFRLG